MLRQSKRISGKIRIAQILEEGLRLSSEFFGIRYLHNEEGKRRFAVIAGRKISRSAVERNHQRRRIYEAIRLLEKEVALGEERGFDIVIIARQAIVKAEYVELREKLAHDLAKLDNHRQ